MARAFKEEPDEHVTVGPDPVWQDGKLVQNLLDTTRAGLLHVSRQAEELAILVLEVVLNAVVEST